MLTTWRQKVGEKCRDVHGTLRKLSVSSHCDQEPSQLLVILSSPGHGKTIGHDASRAIGVLLKPAQTVT